MLSLKDNIDAIELMVVNLYQTPINLKFNQGNDLYIGNNEILL